MELTKLATETVVGVVILIGLIVILFGPSAGLDSVISDVELIVEVWKVVLSVVNVSNLSVVNVPILVGFVPIVVVKTGLEVVGLGLLVIL